MSCIAPIYVDYWIFGWQGTSISSMQFVANRNRGAPTEHVVLAINHGSNILQFDIRCKLADEMQPMLCMIRFIAEVEMILLPSTTTLLYTSYYYVVHSTSITIDIDRWISTMRCDHFHTKAINNIISVFI
jgi:hypothetical protein